jgi:hypothetical protein
MTSNDNQSNPSRDSQDSEHQQYAGPERRQGPRRHPGAHESSSAFIEGIDQRTGPDRRRG